MHHFVEDRVRRAPVGFGAVECDVGIAQQIFGTLVARVRDGHADARGRIEPAALDVRRFGDGRVEPLDARLDVVVDEDDAEFVAAEPGHHLARPHDRAQALSHGEQQRVAGEMAEAVVHDFEVIEVDECHGEAGLARTQRVAELRREEAAVREAGQGVVRCFVDQPVSNHDAVAHVVDHGDRKWFVVFGNVRHADVGPERGAVFALVAHLMFVR